MSDKLEHLRIKHGTELTVTEVYTVESKPPKWSGKRIWEGTHKLNSDMTRNLFKLTCWCECANARPTHEEQLNKNLIKNPYTISVFWITDIYIARSLGNLPLYL